MLATPDPLTRTQVLLFCMDRGPLRDASLSLGQFTALMLWPVLHAEGEIWSAQASVRCCGILYAICMPRTQGDLNGEAQKNLTGLSLGARYCMGLAPNKKVHAGMDSIMLDPK